jgi:hypothetical protein
MTMIRPILIAGLLLPSLALAQTTMQTTVPTTFGGGVGLIDQSKVDANFAAVAAGTVVKTIAVDHSTGTAGFRPNQFLTTLTPASTTTNAWENWYWTLQLNGPGTATGEINLIHPVFTVANGANSTTSEVFEASLVNGGTVGQHNSYLALPTMLSTGTATTVYGYKAQLSNANPTAGAVATYAGLDCEAFTGGGSAPTGSYCIRNGDVSSPISTLGSIGVGTLTAPAAKLFVQGADNSTGTFSIMLKNAATTVVFAVANDGKIQSAGVNSVSCAAGVVVAATMVVTNGIVTHC